MLVDAFVYDSAAFEGCLTVLIPSFAVNRIGFNNFIFVFRRRRDVS